MLRVVAAEQHFIPDAAYFVHMAHVHHKDSHAIVQQLGRVTFQDAIKFPLERFGSRVTSQKRHASPKDAAAIARAIEKYQTKISQLARSGRRSQLAAWNARARVLSVMRSIGFKPHANHVAAALALERGLSEEALLPVVNCFLTANKHVEGGLFIGSLTQVHSSLKQDLPKRVHDLLHRAPQAMSSAEIAKQLELPVTRRNRALITHTLGVLDLMGLTYKLPAAESTYYKWVHACHQNTAETIPEWNLDWNVLSRLSQKPQKISELSLPIKFRGGIMAGSPDGLAVDHSTKLSFLRLKKSGLVSVRSLKSGFGMEAYLSKRGRNLLKEQARLPYLHHELRLALLRLPRAEGELKETDVLLLNRVAKWAAIHSALAREQRAIGAASLLDCVNEVSKRSGYRHSVVYGIASGQIPWKNVSPDRLQKKLLPQFIMREPVLGKYLKEHLGDTGK